MAKVCFIATLMILQGFFFLHVKPCSLWLTASKVSVCKDEVINFTCSANCTPAVHTYYLFENHTLVSSNSHGMWSRTMSMWGVFIYKCVANNTVTANITSDTVTVTVKGDTTTTLVATVVPSTKVAGTETAAGGGATPTAAGGTTIVGGGATITTTAGGGGGGATVTTAAGGGGATVTTAAGGGGGGATVTTAAGGGGGGATVTTAAGGGGGGATLTTAAGGGGATVTTAAVGGGGGATVTTVGGGGGVSSTTPTTPPSSSVGGNKTLGPLVTLNLIVIIDCSGDNLNVIMISVKTAIIVILTEAGFSIHKVTIVTITCNSPLNITLELSFYSGLPTGKTIEKVFEDALKAGSISNLTESNTKYTFKFAGVAIKYSPKSGECKKVCCDGAGGELIVVPACTPANKCEGIKLKEKLEDGHCPGDSKSTCPSTCPKDDDDAGGINSPSFAVIILLAIATFIKIIHC